MVRRSRTRPFLVAILFAVLSVGRAFAATSPPADSAPDGGVVDAGAVMTPPTAVEPSSEFHPLPVAAPRPPSGEPADGGVGAEADAMAQPPAQQGPAQTVTVVGKRVYGASLLEPESIAASDSTTGQAELRLRPRLRTENVLEAVPGLFTVQHAGGGKAQQYFMRGFDLDHGTDIAFFVDGAPINAVSHAHGQGYSDLHFIIPEVIDTLESTKGPYSARVGDFATAGSATFHMADHLNESVGRVEIGADGHERAVVAESPDLGADWRAVVAAEVFNEDGPFIHPEEYDRFNGYAKVTRVLDERSELSLVLMAYGGTWNMSGVLPARAVCGEGDGTPTPAAYAGSHCLSRWDSVDPSQGGATQRYMALASYRRQIERGDIEATVYALHSSLQLFPNDGIAASFQPAGMQYGSQIEQDDARTETGANLRLSRTYTVAGFDVRTTAGLQVRDDVGRRRAPSNRAAPAARRDAGHPGADLRRAPQRDRDRRVRRDRFASHVVAARGPGGPRGSHRRRARQQQPHGGRQTSGYRGAEQFSPKASVVVSPLSWLDLFANFGQGFHTNDARTVLVGTINGVSRR